VSAENTAKHLAKYKWWFKKHKKITNKKLKKKQ